MAAGKSVKLSDGSLGTSLQKSYDSMLSGNATYIPGLSTDILLVAGGGGGGSDWCGGGGAGGVRTFSSYLLPTST